MCQDVAVFSRLAALVTPLRQREVKALIGSQLISGLGDWAGRLALTVLVFDRSQSAWWAAAITVVSLLPWLGPGQVLATFADRFGRVETMIVSDVARAAIFGLILIPQPIWTLLVLAFLAGLAAPPFAGASASALVEVVEPDQYGPTLALKGVMSQAEIMAGYAVGGFLIAALGTNIALAINAGTFLLSAALIATLRSTAAASTNTSTPIGWEGLKRGVRVWRNDPVCMRALLLFVGVSMFMILPEALVVPFADELELADEYIGVFAALIAIGSIVGMVMTPTAGDHLTLLRVVAIRAAGLSALSALLFVTGTVPLVAGLAFIMSGAVDAIAVPTNQVVGERLPTEGRSAAMAVAGGAQYGSQVITIAIAGIIATVSSARVPLTVGMMAASIVCLWAVVRPVKERVPDDVPAVQPT